MGGAAPSSAELRGWPCRCAVLLVALLLHGAEAGLLCPPPGLQGVSGMDYNRLAARHIQGVTAYSATGTALSAVSGRVSYTLRFRGPAVTVDTACSSSLVAMHAAASAVLSRRASLAINAGVNICMMPDTPAMFQRAGMTTANGRRVCGACISLTLARSDPREALHGTSYCDLFSTRLSPRLARPEPRPPYFLQVQGAGRLG